MSDPRGTPVSCPDCGAPVYPQRDQLCAQCGYPLMFLRERPGAAEPQFGVARAPGERDQPAPAAHPILLEPTAPASAPSATEIGCPACREINPATRIRCQRCGTELRPARPTPLELGPMPAPRRSRAWIAVLAAVLAVLAVGTAITIFVLRRDGDATFTQPEPTASVALIAVPASVVSVTATAADPDTVPYGVQNTIDGKRDTAWHSGGHLIATNVGVEVRYAFNRPVKLARVTVINGFARSNTDFTNNHRVQKVRVRTGSAERAWNMADTVEPQRLDLDGAPTSTVTFVIDATYPGTRFKDVCLTEVAFDELR